jgi:hypothetical protein
MIKLPDGGIGVPPGYTQFSGRTAPAPANAQYAEIQFGRYSAGGACIDDVSFRKVEAACSICVNFDRLPNGTPVSNGTMITHEYQASSIWPSGVTFNPGLVVWGGTAWSQTEITVTATFSWYGLIGPFPGVTDCVSFTELHGPGPPVTTMFRAFDRNGNLVAETPVIWGVGGMGQKYVLRAPGMYTATLPIPPLGIIDDFCYNPVTPIGQADFVMRDMLVIPPFVPAGGMTLVRFTIANEGTESAGPASHQIRLVRPSDIGAPQVDVLLRTVATGTLAAGASASFMEFVTIPQNIAPGPYMIRIVADAMGAVSESNEMNNTAQVPITVTGFPG